jgi:hypothetical protein
MACIMPTVPVPRRFRCAVIRLEIFVLRRAAHRNQGLVVTRWGTMMPYGTLEPVFRTS